MRVAIVLGALAALLAIAAFTLYTTAPGVADAERRVAASLRRHGGQDGGLPLPRRLAIATTAAEDERFYRHGAVDPIAMARATWAEITQGRGSGPRPSGRPLPVRPHPWRVWRRSWSVELWSASPARPG